VPHDYHDSVSEVLKKEPEKVFLVYYAANPESAMPEVSFHADIWVHLRTNRNGFTELELHVGQEGICTPKWVNKTQFWTRVD